MTIWVDAQLSPRTARWISERFAIESKALKDLGLRDAEDYQIFESARNSNAIILTKDRDFVHLSENHGSPPWVVWLSCGNTSELVLQQILEQHLPTALNLLDSGEMLVEIGAPDHE